MTKTIDAINSESTIFGDRLTTVCTHKEEHPLYMMPGKNKNNESVAIPIGEAILSRHMLFLGGIGTGKTNAMNLFIRNTRRVLTEKDVVVIFDTKGDYYREFYQPGDIVISNDERATGSGGLDYWNIFDEVVADERVEENVLEIANTLFADKINHTTQPFFPSAAKDLFFALMMHIIRTDSLKDKRNNKSLRAYLNMMTPELMMQVLDQHNDLKAMKSYIYDPKAGQTLGVMAELQQMMREIFVGNFSKNGNLSMRDIVKSRGGKVVFVEYDLSI